MKTNRSFAFREPITSVFPADESTIVGHAEVNGLQGEPAVTVEIRRPRTIYCYGQASITCLLTSLIIISLLFGLLTWFELDIMLFRRLVALTMNVSRLGKDGDSSARILLPGRDELSTLAGEMNDMLDELEASQVELSKSEAMRRSEEHYRELVEVCPDAVIILCDQKCTYANAAAARLLGYKSASELIDVPISPSPI